MTPSATQSARARQRQVLIQFIERAVFGVILAGSLLLVWWSVNRVSHHQRRAANLFQQVSRLSADVELMLSQQSGVKTQEVARRFAAAQADLFPGTQALSEWGGALRESAIPLALRTSFQFTGTRIARVDDRNLTVVQASLELAPDPEIPSAVSAYQRILHYLDRLTLQPRRVDLVDLRFQGGTNGVDYASAQLELWAMDAPARP